MTSNERVAAVKARLELAAFPQSIPIPGNQATFAIGLTKRELFAAMAMQGLVSDLGGLTKAMSECAEERGIEARAAFAIAAVEYADALLAELEKKS